MVRLIIEGREYFGFVTDNLSLPYNTIASTFGFSGLDDYSPIPLRFPKVEIYFNDDLLLTGVIVNQNYQSVSKPTRKRFRHIRGLRFLCPQCLWSWIICL